MAGKRKPSKPERARPGRVSGEAIALYGQRKLITPALRLQDGWRAGDPVVVMHRDEADELDKAAEVGRRVQPGALVEAMIPTDEEADRLLAEAAERYAPKPGSRRALGPLPTKSQATPEWAEAFEEVAAAIVGKPDKAQDARDVSAARRALKQPGGLPWGRLRKPSTKRKAGKR